MAKTWALDLIDAAYFAEGGGSHHWIVTAADGTRYFVTVDNLNEKGFLGATRESAFVALGSAFDTAYELRSGGLDFVVAPLRSPSGETVRRIRSKYSIALFPFLEGTVGRFDVRLAPEDRAALVHLLARLHGATPLAMGIARHASLELSGRRHLESSLQELDRAWSGGPYSEQARALLAAHASAVLRLLDRFDSLSDQVAAANAAVVVTHGEPHPANVMRRAGRLALIDWDTVGMAVPERDLWMVDSGDGRELTMYEDATGRRVNRTAIDLYRLRWRLDDIASFLNQLRSKHEQTADSEHAWASLVLSVRGSLET